MSKQHQWTIPSRPGMKIEQAEDNIEFYSPLLLTVADAERYIETLVNFDIYEVGNSSWMHQSEIVSKLNIQAHQSVTQKSDEFVLEALLTFDKIPLLLQELLTVEAWKRHGLPALLRAGLAARRCSMRVYFILYYEATLANLFEVILYHAHALEAVPEEYLIELVDYCARKIQCLNSGVPFASSQPTTDDPKEYATALESKTTEEDIRGHLGETEFKICVSAVSLMRYLCEHISSLPLPINTRILDNHDILLNLIPLIENPPWTRRLDSGKWEKFIELRWTKVEPVNLLILTKTEAQVWLAVYHLMCNGDCRARYQFNSFRKDQVLRIRRYLNDFMLDQLPVLADVQRYMDELAIMTVPDSSQLGSALLMEQVPVIRARIVANVDWEELAATQIREIFSKYTDNEDPDLKRLAEMYTNDDVEDIIDPSPDVRRADITNKA